MRHLVVHLIFLTSMVMRRHAFVGLTGPPPLSRGGKRCGATCNAAGMEMRFRKCDPLDQGGTSSQLGSIYNMVLSK